MCNRSLDIAEASVLYCGNSIKLAKNTENRLLNSCNKDYITRYNKK